MLHSLALRPVELARRGRWLWLLAPLAAALLATGAFQNRALLPGAAPQARVVPPSPEVFLPPPGKSLPFEVCYFNAAWTPPDIETEAQHLQPDPRYLGLDLARQTRERVHVEVGPFRSASAFGDFIQLSGLWTDANVSASACPADLEHKAELWALQLRLDRFELSGSDLTAFASPQPSGVEAVQVPLPAEAEALHVIDAQGIKLAPDASLRAALAPTSDMGRPA
ncbi:MAG TPA: hypothetical protein VF157_08830 [Chloroflexota bacterium]